MTESRSVSNYREIPSSTHANQEMSAEHPLIHCIGDSHVSFFGGSDRIQPVWPDASHDCLPWFRTYHVGPALAYNLKQLGTQVGGREKLFYILANEIPQQSIVLLSFGEIDCRVHLLKQAETRIRPVEEMVAICLDRYFEVVQEIASQGHKVIVYNAVASRPKSRRFTKNEDTDYPTYGTQSARNRVIHLFNEGARARCKTEHFLFLDTPSTITDSSGSPLIWYFFDNIHLSQRAMPATLMRLSELLPDWKIPLLPVRHPGLNSRLADWLKRRSRRILKEISKIRTF